MKKLTHVAIRYKGEVYSLPRPNRHAHVIRSIPGGVNGPDVQGFLDDEGKFYTRKEAFVLARANGQLDRSQHQKNSYNGNDLYSEDIW